jgi:alpha-galactosidase
MTAKWADLGLKGKRTVRDLWRQQDLGKYDGEFNASVPRHGVVLVRLRAEETTPTRGRVLAAPKFVDGFP